MNFINLVLIMSTAIIVAIAAEGNNSPMLETKVEQLEAMLREQQSVIRDLQQKINKIDNEKNINGQIFDCYRTEDLTTEGIIMFNGCSVDTTTIDPSQYILKVILVSVNFELST